MSETIDYRVDDGVATLTIDLRDRSMNVLTPQFLREFAEMIERVAGDDGVRGAIITSGKSSFLAGADLKDAGEFFRIGSAAEFFSRQPNFGGILRRMETCGKPFVAAINGTALGGGLEIALACHYRVAADAAGSRLGLPEILVGLFPGGGGTQRLPRLIGVAEALKLMMEGRQLKPAEAAALGIVDKLVAPEELMATARQWLDESPEAVQRWDRRDFKVPGGAGQSSPKFCETFMIGTAMTRKRTMGNYPAAQALLSCVYEGVQVPIDTGLRIEQRYFAGVLLDPVARNMIRTVFVSKGEADRLARRPAGIPRLKVRRLGVLGAGMMGAGIAHVAASAGIGVVLLDREIGLAEKGRGYSERLLAKRIAAGRLTSAEAAETLAHIKPTADYADLAGCDLVIEAVFEDRAVKAGVTRRAEEVLEPRAILATNTSTLPITGLATASLRPERFIGLHFFSPVDKMALVEIIRGRQTSDEALALAMDFVQQIRKTPIVVNDSRGFFTSRFCSAYLNEGTTMLLEGVSPALIENGGRLAGMPVGPLALLDEVSIDLSYHIREQTRRDLGERYIPASNEPVITLFHEKLGRFGRKNGRGMYDYPADGHKRLWPGLAEHFPPAASQPSVELVRKRLLYAQALEAARCIEENVLTNPADGDVGALLGLGFPAYTGGPLSLIDTVGAARFVAECDELAVNYGQRFTPPTLLRKMAEERGSFYPHA